MAVGGDAPHRPAGVPGDVAVHEITKRFEALVAVHPTSFDVPAGSLVTLLGPSGSGKTTILKMIAGFEEPTCGRVRIAGRDVTELPPYRRDIGFVFQQYALFPHLSVAENIAYPLQMRKVPRSQITTAVRDALELVHLGGLGDRRPSQLSGGQQQRVALARAVIFRPPVLLMDEPMAALDKRLREEMQIEIRNLQRRLGITTIAVTHDQSEALIMSDCIIVLDHGRVQQIGAPLDLYHRPQNEFVANFIGESNLLKARLERDGDGVVAVSPALGRLRLPAGPPPAPVGSDVLCVIRPEIVSVGPPDAADEGLAATLTEQIFGGDMVRLGLRLSDGTAFVAKVPARKVDRIPAVGSAVLASWPVDEISVVPREVP